MGGRERVLGLENGIIDLGKRMEDRNDSNKGYQNSKRIGQL